MADMAGVLCSINEISSSKSMVWYNQCLAFKGFIDSTVRDLHSNWVNHCAEESKVASDVTSQLLTVLQRGLNLLQQCAQPEKRPVLGSAGEFCDIVEDASEYCKMINNIIMHVISGPSAEQKYVLTNGLQDRLESDCLRVLDQLKLCYEEDKDALIKQACQISNSSCLSGLIRSLQTGFNSSIAEADFQEDLVLLGIGSFGAVYKTQWCGLPVAIKVFTYPDHFQAEYDLFLKLAAINSSHIIKILGHYQNKNKDKCLVMELMDKDLKMFLHCQDKSRDLSLIESLDIMTQVAKGMRVLHDKDVIHRDLKPANILVKPENLMVKLADFGASKANFQTVADKGLHTSKKGTGLYMAPEMEMGKYDSEGPYSRKVDVYSFGIICLEILTRKQMDKEMKENIKKCQLPWLPESIPNDLLHMIHACLEQEASNRPSFQEIVKKLWLVKKKILTPRGVHMVPQVPTSTGKKVIFFTEPGKYDVDKLPIDSMVDIQLPVNKISQHARDDSEIFEKFKRLMDQGKQFNLSFAIGGEGSEWESYFSMAFSRTENRTRFVNSILDFCKAYPFFNGLSIEWKEWGEDSENFILLLQELRDALPRYCTIALRGQIDHSDAIGRAIHLIDQIHLPFKTQTVIDSDIIPRLLSKGVPRAKIFEDVFHAKAFGGGSICDLDNASKSAERATMEDTGGIRTDLCAKKRCHMLTQFRKTLTHCSSN